MVEERVTDGRRIAELLASEVTGRAGALARLSVNDATPDVEPTTDGAHAYDVVVEAGDGVDGRRLAGAFVQPGRVRLESSVAPETTLAAARERDLRARPRATTPPAALVFVESGAQTKRAADLLGVVAASDTDASSQGHGD